MEASDKKEIDKNFTVVEVEKKLLQHTKSSDPMSSFEKTAEKTQ